MSINDWVHLVIGFSAGLVLFLFGIARLSDELRAVAGERMKRIIGRFTTNRFAGVGTGAATTAALDSSSAVSIMVIGLIDAELMDLSRALGVVMGANIGTTLSSQVFALDIISYGPVLLLPGLLMRWQGKSKRLQRIGGAIFALGLVFFALSYLGQVMRPLSEVEGFRDAMLRMENPILGVLAGAAFTAAIQSSSAMMGILIALVGQGSVTLEAATAIMLGAEVGTCANVLIATIGRSREAVRVGLFQLAFNLASVAVFIGLTGPLTRFGEWLAPDDAERQLANAHVAFNVGSVVLFIGLARTAARGLRRLIPAPESEDRAGEVRNDDGDEGTADREASDGNHPDGRAASGDGDAPLPVPRREHLPADP